jgi:hypothetical protein
MLNHLTAQSWCARASSPLQLHSILSVSPPSFSSTRQILQTASSSGISLPPSPGTSTVSSIPSLDAVVLTGIGRGVVGITRMTPNESALLKLLFLRFPGTESERLILA